MRWLSLVITFLVFALPYASRLEARGDGDTSLSIRVSKRSPGPVEQAWENRIMTSLEMEVDIEGEWMKYHTTFNGQPATIKWFWPSTACIRDASREGQGGIEDWMIREVKRIPTAAALGIEDRPHGNYYVVITEHKRHGELHVEHWNTQ